MCRQPRGERRLNCSRLLCKRHGRPRHRGTSADWCCHRRAARRHRSRHRRPHLNLVRTTRARDYRASRRNLALECHTANIAMNLYHLGIGQECREFSRASFAQRVICHVRLTIMALISRELFLLLLGFDLSLQFLKLFLCVAFFLGGLFGWRLFSEWILASGSTLGLCEIITEALDLSF